MGIRDEEIKRLEQYAKGLGLRVEYRQYRPGKPSAAMIHPDHRMIVYIWPKKSKTQIILDMLHELGHHLSYIYNGRQDSEALTNALVKEEAGVELLTKEERKQIYKCEQDDTTYWDRIITEVDIRLPQQKIQMQKEFDIWIYRFYYLKGFYPGPTVVQKKAKQLKRKYYGSKV